MPCEWITEPSPLVYREKRMGPRTEPWGTPVVRLRGSDYFMWEGKVQSLRPPVWCFSCSVKFIWLPPFRGLPWIQAGDSWRVVEWRYEESWVKTAHKCLGKQWKERNKTVINIKWVWCGFIFMEGSRSALRFFRQQPEVLKEMDKEKKDGNKTCWKGSWYEVTKGWAYRENARKKVSDEEVARTGWN